METIKFFSKSPYPWFKLSNFYHGPKGEGGFWFRSQGTPVFAKTVEHFYQSCKTVDSAERAKVRSALTPQAARRLGRLVTLRPEWKDDAFKVAVMDWALKRKFRNVVLAELLQSTQDSILVHYSPWDTFWGVDDNGNGRNMLGVLLMKVRNDLA